MISDPRFVNILSTIRYGSTLGITPLPRNATSFLPPHRIRDTTLFPVLDQQFIKWKNQNKIDGPFPLSAVERALGGPVQSSPIKAVEKSTPEGMPQKWRFPEDCSFPYEPRQNQPPSVNNDLDPDDFPAKYYSFLETQLHFSVKNQPHVRFLTIDIEDAFECLDVHPSVRHRIILNWGGGIWIRKCALFGLRTTPGLFCQFMDCSLTLLESKFNGRVRAINSMDDISIAILDPSIREEEIIEFMEELGWRINKAKSQPLARISTFIGITWDPDELTMTVPTKKHDKYKRKVEEALKKGKVEGVKLEEVESLVGSLQYLACIVPSLRPRLRVLYRFRSKYPSEESIRHFNDKEIKNLEWWKRYLAAPIISAPFLTPPSICKATLASDASDTSIGIFVQLFDSKDQPRSPLVARFDLPPGWKEGEGYIGNAEAWGVEALLEAAIRLGMKDCSLKFLCDSMNVVDSWNKGWSRNNLLNLSIFRLLRLSNLYSITLVLEYVHTSLNPADEISRGSYPRGSFSFHPSQMPSPPPGCIGGPDPHTPSTPFTDSAEGQIPNLLDSSLKV